MPIPQLSAADLALLRQYDTPTICNVIELFDLQPRTAGYMDGRIRACFPEMPPIAGYAATATMRCEQPRAQGDVYGSLDRQVARFAELPGPPIVVFQDLDDPPVAATFGEILCTTYQAFGAGGHDGRHRATWPPRARQIRRHRINPISRHPRIPQ